MKFPLGPSSLVILMFPRLNSKLLKRLGFDNGKDDLGFLNLHFGD